MNELLITIRALSSGYRPPDVEHFNRCRLPRQAGRCSWAGGYGCPGLEVIPVISLCCRNGGPPKIAGSSEFSATDKASENE